MLPPLACVSPLPPFAVLLAMAALLAAPVSGRAQCTDPVPPRAGFAYKYERDKAVTLSDSYKTYANVVYPDVAPGPCGWPLLVHVHGLGMSRSGITSDMVELVRRGFFLVTYDVRGQGDARTQNGTRGSRLWALDEWIDLAEIIEWTVARYPGRVDAKRVGVFGDSQGAVHAWAAAAYSDRLLPTNSRRSKPYPPIAAVVPRFFSPSSIDVLVPQGTAFLHQLTGLAYATSSTVVQLDSSYRSKLAGYLDAGDAAGLDAYLRTIAGKDFLPQLRTTAVPTLAIAAWQDVWMDPSGVLAAFTSLPATTPKRLLLTTGQHGMPVNDRELQRQIRLTHSWFERFLKDHHEPVELGPPILASIAPADRAGYADRSNLWRQRAEVAYPPADVRAQRQYLRSRGRLRPEAASKGEVYDVVQNTVASGYTPRSFLADGGSPSLVLKKVPLSRFGYETEALDEDLELAGFPRLSLALEPSARNFLIAARLVAIAPDDSERVLTSGARLVRLASAPAPMRLFFELGGVGTVLPRGYALRLEVGNHDLHQALATDVFRRLPHFSNSTVRVVHDGNSEQSWLELPVRDRVQPDLASSAATISVTAPGTQTLVVRSSLDWKGSAYIVVLGLSGQGPPVPLAQGTRLWLVPDDLTLALMGVVNRPGLEGFLGVLDAQGRATSRLDLGRLPSLPVELVGQFLQVCPIVAGPALGPTAGTGIRLRFE